MTWLVCNLMFTYFKEVRFLDICTEIRGNLEGNNWKRIDPNV